MSILDDLQAFATEVQALPLRDHQITHTIDGLVYTSTKLPCQKGLDVFFATLAMVGRGLTHRLATGDLAGLDLSVLATLAEQAIRHGAVEVAKDLLGQTTCGTLRSGGLVGSKMAGNVKAAFDAHFSGEYLHLLRVCLFVMAHNFRGPTLGVP